MTIDPSTGVVTWSPTTAQAGTQTISIVASDDRGASTTQTFQLNVTVLVTIEPPTITSTPPQSVLLGTTYLYAVAATGPAGVALTYSLVAPPSGAIPDGMTIDPNTGVITWTPTVDEAGPNQVVLAVSDSGGTATQDFTVIVQTVPVPQSPPTITSIPPAFAMVGQSYAYDAQGQDPQNEVLAWSLDQVPAGMSINPTTGPIRWTPTAGQVGSQTVVVRLTDAGGAAVTQGFDLTVLAAAAPPTITSTPSTTDTVGQLYVYQVGATTNTGQP